MAVTFINGDPSEKYELSPKAIGQVSFVLGLVQLTTTCVAQGSWAGLF
jgi:hypothetical protein